MDIAKEKVEEGLGSEQQVTHNESEISSSYYSALQDVEIERERKDNEEGEEFKEKDKIFDHRTLENKYQSRNSNSNNNRSVPLETSLLPSYKIAFEEKLSESKIEVTYAIL